MILNVKDFKNVAKTILPAVDNKDVKAANLELVAKDNVLSLNVTNLEYYVSVKFALTSSESFRAVVKAQQFLDLIASLTVDEIELSIEATSIKITAGKSNYKLAMIYENGDLMELPTITLNNKTVEMSISNDILQSILNVNGKELLKAKALDKDKVSESQKSYYVTDEGCFTYVTGACLNSFKLEKPIKMLLNDRVVKLFKLFDTDVDFSFGYDALPNGVLQTKIIFETENIYLAAIIVNNDILLNQVLGPYNATKNYLGENYTNKLVVSVNDLNSAITRIMSFSKDDKSVGDAKVFAATFTIDNNDLIITDSIDNCEAVKIENNIVADTNYKMTLNLNDVKLLLDGCSSDFITLNFGNHKSVVFSRPNISNLIPELMVA